MLKKFLIGTFAVAAIAFAMTASAAYDFGTTTLRVGSKGEAVKAVQTVVGATPVDGVFGPMTKAKVMAWQAANGLSADGVFGPASKAKANGTTTTTTSNGCQAGFLFNPVTGAKCDSSTTTPSTVGPLTGGAGDMELSSTSTDVENEVVEGNTENVLGFKIKAVDSDIAVKNVKLTFENEKNSFANGADTSYDGSYRLSDYADSVSIYEGSTKVGSADVSDFTKKSADTDHYNTYYTKNIALSSDVVVRKGEKTTFYVKVEAVSNIDGDDVGENNWQVTASDIRFQDATGVIMTSSEAEDATFKFTDLATSGDVKLTISKASSSPAAGNVEADDSSTTSDVPMLAFKLKAAGSDMTFDELTVDLTSVGAFPNMILDELTLENGSDKLGTVDSFSTNDLTSSATFDLDDTFTIDADSTETFTVYAKVKEICTDGVSGCSAATDFSQGDSLKIDLTTDGIAAEDENTDEVKNETGSATGTVQTFYSEGAIVTYVIDSFTAEDTSGSTAVAGTIGLKFKVTAMGDTDVTISENQTAGATSGNNVVVHEVTGGDEVSPAIVTSSDLEADGGIFTVSAGDSATFTLSSKFTDTDGFVRLTITSVDGTTVSNIKTGAH